MTRDELIARTRQLVDEGDRLVADPSLGSLRVWLQHSDDLLSTAWGTMDRYHLSWLMVGKPKAIVRGRPMTPDEEAAYVREVAEQKTAALRMSLDAASASTCRSPARPVAWVRAMPERSDAGPRARPCGGMRTRPRRPTRSPVTTCCSRLRLDQHIPGLVDGYFGPADLKAEVDMEQRRSPARLRDDAVALRDRLRPRSPTRIGRGVARRPARRPRDAGREPGRRRRCPYLDVRRAHASRIAPAASRPEATFDAAAARLDELLPGDGPLAARLEAWDAGLEIPVERLPAVIDWLVARFREPARATVRAAGRRGPARLARHRPAVVGLQLVRRWSSVTCRHQHGPARSAAPDLVHTVAHETYPGHHLEHAWKEADLVDAPGRLEASILLINTPECLISEGLADLGTDFAVPADDELADLLVEIVRPGRAGARRRSGRGPRRRRASVAIDRSAGRARGHPRERRDPAPRGRPVPRSRSSPTSRTSGGFSEPAAPKRLEFIEHPLWRTYVFVYAEGEALLRRWLEAVPAADRPARFGRLLREPLTPADGHSSRLNATRSSPSPS